tara:strand:- start:361 stop:483 length:123 start_codon:yes stop_codon:yes gene_type:complete
MKTKTELLQMSKEDIEKEENTAWIYHRKVRAIIKFMEIEE